MIWVWRKYQKPRFPKWFKGYTKTQTRSDHQNFLLSQSIEINKKLPKARTTTKSRICQTKEEKPTKNLIKSVKKIQETHSWNDCRSPIIWSGNHNIFTLKTKGSAKLQERNKPHQAIKFPAIKPITETINKPRNKNPHNGGKRDESAEESSEWSNLHIMSIKKTP